jgi:hypothetical protein
VDQHLKKSLIYTAVLVVIFIIALTLIGNVVVSIIGIILLLVILALVWRTSIRLCREKSTPAPVVKEEKKPSVVQEEDDGITTRTGLTCTQAGTYVCSEHEDKEVEMEVGKRFPPCRGDGKGHGAVWILQK